MLSRAFFHNFIYQEAFFMNFFLFSRWNSGYHEALLTNFFLFSRWNSGYHEALLTNFFLFSRWNSLFSFFTMEFWLSRSPSHELFFLFSRWNSGYHEALLTNFFSRWNSGYHEALLTNFFFFHDGILAITKPFSRTFFSFLDGILEIRNLGEDSFYTYIIKNIYIGSASLKTLPLDLKPPLQGKEYGPLYSNTTRKRKDNVFSRNHL
jgi:hypothetical protein